ncbi:MAG: cellulose binding domain-containing protein [Clostridiales bacterium]|nr:cellulose binding domain-containing protein [Clostridiales bacterium]
MRVNIKKLRRLGALVVVLAVVLGLFQPITNAYAVESEEGLVNLEEKEQTLVEEKSSQENISAQVTPENSEDTEPHITPEVLENTESEVKTVTQANQDKVFIGEGFEVRYEVTSSWPGAFNTQLTITNTSDNVIDNWAISFHMPYEITDLWNGMILSNENGIYTIKNCGYNQDINVGESINFGFTGHVEGDFVLPDSFIIKSFEKETDIDDITFTFHVDQDWKSGFNGTITIRNNTEKAIEDWSLEFDFDHQINDFWTAEIISAEKNHYLIKNRGYNANIQPGECVSLGFSGTLGNVVNEPKNFLLKERVNSEDELIKYRQLNVTSIYGINILTWEVKDADNVYYINRKNEAGEMETIQEVTGTNYFYDVDVVSGKEYTYQVCIIDKENITELSQKVMVTTSEMGEEPEILDEQVLGIVNLDADYDELDISYQDDDYDLSVTRDITLLSEGNNGSKITWISGNESAISILGNVNRSTESDIEVVMTAILSNGNLYRTKSFTLIVKKKNISTGTVKDMTWTDLEEANNGELPDLKFYSDGSLKRINGTFTDIKVYEKEDALNSIRCLQTILGIGDIDGELVFSHKSTNSVDQIYYFNQYYKGLPIVGACITVIARLDGTVYCLNSSYMKEISVDTCPAVDMSNRGNSSRLFILRDDEENNILTLCWEVIDDENRIYYDAHTGEIIYSEALLYSASETASGTDMSGNIASFPVKTTGFSKWKKYYMEDTTRKISICDGRGTQTYTTISNSDNKWNDPNAITTYNNVIKTYDFFNNLGWKGYNGKNGAMKIVVHYETLEQQLDAKGNPVTDASGNPVMVWTPVCNAYGGGDTLKFGDGNGTSSNYWGEDQDLVAHEFTHSVTRAKLGNLPYSNLTGALNEAYSDIFGELVDSNRDWINGVKVYSMPSKANYMRDFATPSNKYKPSQLFGSSYHLTCINDNHGSHSNCDNGGVHTNSTILTHAAYLMIQKGLTYDQLAKLWYTSYDYYYGNTTPDFYDCKDAVLHAAESLGFSLENKKSIREAFRDVNISKNDITVTVLDAVNNTAITSQIVNLKSLDKTKCNLKGTCCAGSNCYRLDSCDPDTCYHLHSSSCQTSCTNQGCCQNSTINSTSRVTNNNGKVTFCDVVKGYHRIRIIRRDYQAFNELIYVDDTHTNFTVKLETPYNNSISGKITIADKDTNIANNKPLAGATIALEKKTGTIALKKSVKTDANGNYKITDVPAGVYELTVSKYGYITVIQTISIYKNQNEYYNLVIESISTEYAGKGYAGGSIIDVYNGNGVKGLTLEIYKGLHLVPGYNIPTGKKVETLISGANGTYHTSALDAGNYTVVVKDKRENIDDSDRYMDGMFTIKVLGNTDILSQNGSVSKGLKENQLRIVLTWGISPRDLDSHLYIKTVDNAAGHVYYGHKSVVIDGKEIANLDLDDTSSYGPETTTIFTEIDGEFKFAVHDYTNRSSSNSSALANSGATVCVYSGYATTPVRIYFVPSGKGVMWNVFSYDSKTGKITTIDTLTN